MSNTELSNKPTPDSAESNAYFPSPYSLSLYTAKKTDYDGTTYPHPYKGDLKILMVGTDERYIKMKNGKYFSSGNHPVETLLPIFHLDAAGFKFDISTLSGNSVKFENWAIPTEDPVILETLEKYETEFQNPLKLDDLVKNLDNLTSKYAGIFIPGGHGVLSKIPESESIKILLNWAIKNDKYIITLCHGPACLIAASINEKNLDNYPFKGYKICVFPDSLDTGANQDIGYMPGQLDWLVGERLKKLGVEIINDDLTGKCTIDRKLITGDSPLASNGIGKLAAETLLNDPSLK